MKKAVATKAMKAKTTSMMALKAMQVMKAEWISVITMGKRARVCAFYSKKEKTQSGRTMASLVRSKTGKIVSKAASARQICHPSSLTHCCL